MWNETIFFKRRRWKCEEVKSIRRNVSRWYNKFSRVMVEPWTRGDHQSLFSATFSESFKLLHILLRSRLCSSRNFPQVCATVTASPFIRSFLLFLLSFFALLPTKITKECHLSLVISEDKLWSLMKGNYPSTRCLFITPISIFRNNLLVFHSKLLLLYICIILNKIIITNSCYKLCYYSIFEDSTIKLKNWGCDLSFFIRFRSVVDKNKMREKEKQQMDQNKKRVRGVLLD